MFDVKVNDNGEEVININIWEVNKVYFNSKENPGVYIYGYERVSQDKFKEFYKSDVDNICPRCGLVNPEGEECNCTENTYISEEELINIIYEVYEDISVNVYINDKAF